MIQKPKYTHNTHTKSYASTRVRRAADTMDWGVASVTVISAAAVVLSSVAVGAWLVYCCAPRSSVAHASADFESNLASLVDHNRAGETEFNAEFNAESNTESNTESKTESNTESKTAAEDMHLGKCLFA